MNWQILPVLKFLPKELLLSLIVNTTPMPLEVSSSMPVPQDFDTHMAYAAQQRLDGYSEAVQHAMDCKVRFNRWVLNLREGEVAFEKGHLIQIHRNDLAKSISSERKLTPMWSKPHRVSERMLNSYKLEMLGGQVLDGEYHARRIRRFIPREGTELTAQQREVEEGRTEENCRQTEENQAEEPGSEEVEEHDDSERGPEGNGKE